MKVLLIQPPIEDYYTTPIRNYPLGLLFIASKVYDLCDVEILDLRFSRKPAVIDSPFKELETYYSSSYSPFSLFHKYQRLGKNKNEIASIIRNRMPDVVGISSLFSTYFDEALEIAKIAKSINSKILTVMGGNHPTLFPESVLKNPDVDFVIRGEGEEPFRLLIETLSKNGDLSNVPGFCYKKAEEIVVSKIFTSESKYLDLKRELLNREYYRYGKGYVAPVLTSRGCPFNCSFCGRPAARFRHFEIDDVKRDIEKLISLGYDTIDFEDDYFDLTNKKTIDILSWLKGKNLRLTAMNGVVPKINNEIKNLIKDAGFQRINISLVDVSQDIQREVNRGQFEYFDKILDEFINTDIPIETHFIIGLPEQRLEHIIDTIIYLAEKKLLLGPSVYYLAPGSKKFDEFQAQNGIFNLKYARSSVAYPVNKDLDRTKIMTLMKLVRFVNYVKKQIDLSGNDLDASELIKVAKDKDREILLTLMKEKRLISYNGFKNKFEPEIFSREIIESFFQKLKFIKGYKSKNLCNFK